MRYYQIQAGQPVDVTGRSWTHEGITHPAIAQQRWTSEGLLAAGLLPEDDQLPTLALDDQITGHSLEVQADRVVKTYTVGKVSYQVARERAYAAAGMTWPAWADAEYKARKGDASELEALDAAKDAIKAQYPKPAED